MPDGHEIGYVQAGQGRDVVLIHGTLTTMDDMVLGPMDRLARDFRVTAFDRPGHGLSTRGRLEGTLTQQASRLHEAVTLLGLDRPTLVGHSAGGTVVVHYALRFPDTIAGVVALAPIVLPEPRLEQVLFGGRAWLGAGDVLAGTFGPLMDAALNPVLWNAMFLPQVMPDRFRARFPFGRAGRPSQMQATGEDAVEFPAGLLWNLAHYYDCPVPVVVLGGDRDIVVNPLHGRALATMLPHARYVALPGYGHMIHHFRANAIADAVGEIVDPDRILPGRTTQAGTSGISLADMRSSPPDRS